MKEDILKLFIEKGFLLDKDMLNFLSELKDEEVANEILTKIALISHEKLITKNLVDSNLEKIKPVLVDLDKDKKKIVEKFFVNISVSVEVKKETEIEGNVEENEIIERVSPIKVLSSPVLPAKKLVVKDFVKHFRNRYNFLKGVLQQRDELEGLISIDKIVGNNRNFSIIGIVSSKRITKNKNLILEVEDLTGKAKVLINQNKEEVFEKSKEILLDDVIGFKVSGSRDFLFVNDLFYPDSFLREKHRSSEEIYALFVSDFHLGSKNFLEDNFSKFIGWLNGEGCDEKQKQVLKKISERVKYYSSLADLKYQKINITSAQKRWGSCSAQNNLNFPQRLALAPNKVIDYVVVHELCHIKHKNHSQNFWQEVFKIMPNYKIHCQWLKNHGYLLK